MLAVSHRTVSDSLSFVFSLFSLSLSLSLSFYFKSLVLVVQMCISSCCRQIRARVLVFGCAMRKPLAHLLFNEFACSCRKIADNPLLECTPPNNAQFFTGPPICSTPFPPPSPPPPSFTAPPSPAFIPGDVNGDGTVNISDIVFIIAFVAGNTSLPGPFAAADIDGNGAINILVSQSLQDFAGVFFFFISFPPSLWCARFTLFISSGCATFVMVCRMFRCFSAPWSKLPSWMSVRGFSLFQLLGLLFIACVWNFYTSSPCSVKHTSPLCLLSSECMLVKKEQ